MGVRVGWDLLKNMWQLSSWILLSIGLKQSENSFYWPRTRTNIHKKRQIFTCIIPVSNIMWWSCDDNVYCCFFFNILITVRNSMTIVIIFNPTLRLCTSTHNHNLRVTYVEEQQERTLAPTRVESLITATSFRWSFSYTTETRSHTLKEFY